MRRAPLALALLLSGCGYIASPLPPLANIPARIIDLAAIQRGDHIVVQFTPPQLTTEGVELHPPLALDLRIGPPPNPWNENQWSAAATRVPEPSVTPGTLIHFESPGSTWVGKEVAVAARVAGANGKYSGWSNVAHVSVIPAPERPVNLRGEVTPAGLHLTWQARREHFRVLRSSGTSDRYTTVAPDVTHPEWTDTSIQFGTPYRYIVQTFVPQGPNREAQSDLSEPYSITPEPAAPAAPTGLRAVPAPNSVELSWESTPTPELAGFRIYRGESGGPLTQIGETGPVPAYSDRTAQHGHNYRYAVTAVSRSGKESPQSPSVEIAFP